MLLPTVMRFNAPTCLDKYVEKYNYFPNPPKLGGKNTRLSQYVKERVKRVGSE
jgi:hypothetical protein